MRIYELLRKKRDGEELTAAEIRHLLRGFVAGDVPDYQMSAFLMAVYFQGMTRHEIQAFTQAMVDSGDQLDLSEIPGVIVDKHSTGGVGDKTTLVLVPLVAAAGVKIMKMSGRGLGFTGGTIDKLESFTGFRTEFSLSEMIRLVQRHGACIGSQTGNLTPADKRVYALRDVTATVESIPLVASSVMSKKLASGAHGFALDVKCGSGAFMKDLSQAEELARTMMEIAHGAGRGAVALVTDMEQPLGYAVGNALEVKEAIYTLRGEGPSDLVELVLALGSEMLQLGGVASSTDEATTILRRLLDNGAGLDKLRELVVAQGGDGRMVDDPELLPSAPYTCDIPAPAAGYIHAIDAYQVGSLVMELGAGRVVQGGSIDLSVGMELSAKVGQYVDPGQTIGRMHAKSHEQATQAITELHRCMRLGVDRPLTQPLVRLRIPPT